MWPIYVDGGLSENGDLCRVFVDGYGIEKAYIVMIDRLH